MNYFAGSQNNNIGLDKLTLGVFVVRFFTDFFIRFIQCEFLFRKIPLLAIKLQIVQAC